MTGDGGRGSGEYTPIREVLREAGVELPGNLDDEAVVQQLVQAYQQAQAYQSQLAQLQPLAQYGQLAMQHWDKFQDWLRGQQAQQQQAEKPWWSKWWNPPEYNPAWERLVERDPVTGQLRAVQGADPTILPKYLAYHQYQRQMAERLLANPFEFFQEPVQHLARQVAQELIEKHLNHYQDVVFSDQFVQQNSSWLHQRDQAGNVVVAGYDPQTGRPIPALTPEGKAFAQYVLEAEGMGIRDVRLQQRYATQMLERAIALQRLSQQNATQNGQQLKQQFLQQAAGANHVPGQSGSIQPESGKAQNARLSLEQMMKQNFKQAGFQVAD